MNLGPLSTWVSRMAEHALPAGAAFAGLELGGEALAAPGWLMGLAQVVVVVSFATRAAARENRRMHERLDELAGRLEGLACVKARPCPATRPSSPRRARRWPRKAKP